MQYTRDKVDDNFGKGTCHIFRFSDTSASAALVQKIYTYDKRPYILTEVELTGDAGISSNYLAPVVTETSVAWFPRSEQNRMLFVPWDNDGFIRYECHKLTGELTSYEVTSLYHGDSRKGVVLVRSSTTPGRVPFVSSRPTTVLSSSFVAIPEHPPILPATSYLMVR